MDASRSLQRAGFTQVTRAEKILNEGALADLDLSRLVWLLSASAEPDQGLINLVRLREAMGDHTDTWERVWSDDDAARRLTAVLGYSSTLSDFLITHPYAVGDLAGNQWAGADIPRIDHCRRDSLVAHEACDLVRVTYWRQIVAIAAWDLTADHPTASMDLVAAAISDAASQALDEAVAIAQREIDGGGDLSFSVIAMGKTGGRELNYISDVDVVYVIDPQALTETEAIAVGTKVGEKVRALVSSPATPWPLWELDLNLRPEGKDGPLVRTLDSYKTYYARWAQNWEFQALLKARPVAGDPKLGQRFIDELWPLVWTAASREGFVDSTRHMRARVESLIPAKDADRALKLGRGGLRDVEFTVQLLQLVHGRVDESVRVRSTLDAITALAAAGYISRADAGRIESHYRFLRTLEHRIQLHRFKRSHVVPRSAADLHRIARSLRGEGIDGSEALEAAWRRVQREVREMHQEIYYRPLIGVTASLDTDTVLLEPDAAKARLHAVGFKNPRSALAHIEVMTRGVSRTATIQRHIMPAMIGWLAEGPEPDGGLAAFRTLSEKLGNTSWYMRLLRDSGVVAQRLARILSTSRLLATMIPDLSESISWLDDDALLQPRTREELRHELEALLSRRTIPESMALAGRYIRRRELVRCAMGQTLRLVDDATVREALSHAADVVVEAALRGALSELSDHAASHCVIAMGRLGGEEMGYASDADLMFVYDPVGDAQTAEREAITLATRTLHLMSFVDREPGLPGDLGLRPEGKNGPVSRSLGSYREYYERWVDTWEVQALLRARVCAGDSDVGSRFIALIDPLRYRGLSSEEIRAVRTMKARVEAERIPRGVDPSRHLKLGRGSLADVEWTIQLLQLVHAAHVPGLRVTQTLRALDGAREAQIIEPDEADRLVEAWIRASAMRNWNVLATGRLSGPKIDVLTHDDAELAIISALAGSDRRDIEEDYLACTRRARAVVTHVFYGE